MKPSIEIRGLCPYCEYAFEISATSICGELAVMRCLDCTNPFLVEVTVEVKHKVRALADVDSDAVLDAMTGHPDRPGEPEQHDEACACEHCVDPETAASYSALPWSVPSMATVGKRLPNSPPPLTIRSTRAEP